MRKPKLVHLTHHSCLANGLKAIELSPIGANGYRTDRFADAFGRYARHPASFGHLNCRYGSHTSLLTLNLDDVTCPKCLNGIASESPERLLDASEQCRIDSDREWYEKRAENWCDEHELKLRTWLVCCRHSGAPAPAPRRQVIKRLREARATVAYNTVRIATLGRIWAGAAQSAEAVEKALDKLEPSDRKLMRGIVAKAKKADALLAKVVKLGDSMDAIAKRAASQIRKTAVVEA